jgi:hypothetical protein
MDGFLDGDDDGFAVLWFFGSLDLWFVVAAPLCVVDEPRWGATSATPAADDDIS